MNNRIGYQGDIIHSPGVFPFTFDKIFIYSNCVSAFYPCILIFSVTLVQIRQNFQFTCVENEKLGSVLLCFLGVALLKIVYKKANQRADFYLYKYIFGISVQLNDIVLNKSRAIAGQRGSSLLYQQWYTVMLLCCWENINFSICSLRDESKKIYIRDI